jgi:hypothetical protein
MVTAEDNPDKGARESSALPEGANGGARRRRKVHPFRLRLHHAQRKALAKAVVFLILLLALVVVWYWIATQN